MQNFSQHVERLLDFDPRLKQLAEFGLPEISNEPSFASGMLFRLFLHVPNQFVAPQTLICDWDKENVALLHCVECGAQSYCAECDEVLHRPPDKRHHKRIPTHQVTTIDYIDEQYIYASSDDKCRGYCSWCCRNCHRCSCALPSQLSTRPTCSILQSHFWPSKRWRQRKEAKEAEERTMPMRYWSY